MKIQRMCLIREHGPRSKGRELGKSCRGCKLMAVVADIQMRNKNNVFHLGIAKNLSSVELLGNHITRRLRSFARHLTATAT